MAGVVADTPLLKVESRPLVRIVLTGSEAQSKHDQGGVFVAQAVRQKKSRE